MRTLNQPKQIHFSTRDLHTHTRELSYDTIARNRLRTMHTNRDEAFDSMRYLISTDIHNALHIMHQCCINVDGHGCQYWSKVIHDVKDIISKGELTIEDEKTKWVVIHNNIKYGVVSIEN